jgi:hypothetical protein
MPGKQIPAASIDFIRRRLKLPAIQSIRAIGSPTLDEPGVTGHAAVLRHPDPVCHARLAG